MFVKVTGWLGVFWRGTVPRNPVTLNQCFQWKCEGKRATGDFFFFFFLTQETEKSHPSDRIVVSHGETCILRKGNCVLWKGEKTLRELWESRLKFKHSPRQLVEAKMRPQSPGQRRRAAGARMRSGHRGGTIRGVLG